MEWNLNDPFFNDNLKCVQNIYRDMTNQFRLSAALAGYEYYISEYAHDMAGNLLPDTVMVMADKNIDQSDAREREFRISCKLFGKYKECMMASGVPKELLRLPPYYGCLEKRCPEYIGKINEAPFFEYVQELIREAEEPNKSKAQRAFEEMLEKELCNNKSAEVEMDMG